ncbi:hypothetical protein ON010_g3829 [Phytophthora cinnamomi]|nr:hypothetical protein ON010_g3829 [Phytophthora cinnamomi]
MTTIIVMKMELQYHWSPIIMMTIVIMTTTVPYLTNEMLNTFVPEGTIPVRVSECLNRWTTGCTVAPLISENAKKKQSSLLYAAIIIVAAVPAVHDHKAGVPVVFSSLPSLLAGSGMVWIRSATRGMAAGELNPLAPILGRGLNRPLPAGSNRCYWIKLPVPDAKRNADVIVRGFFPPLHTHNKTDAGMSSPAEDLTGNWEVEAAAEDEDDCSSLASGDEERRSSEGGGHTVVEQTSTSTSPKLRSMGGEYIISLHNNSSHHVPTSGQVAKAYDQKAELRNGASDVLVEAGHITITASEFNAYFGLEIAMSIYPMSEIAEFWEHHALNHCRALYEPVPTLRTPLYNTLWARDVDIEPDSATAMWIAMAGHQTETLRSTTGHRLVVSDNFYSHHTSAKALLQFTDCEMHLLGTVRINLVDKWNKPAVAAAVARVGAGGGGMGSWLQL